MDFNIAIHLSLLGWTLASLGVCCAAGALYFFGSTFFLKTQGDYDFGILFRFIIRLAIGIILTLIAVILFLCAK